MVGAAAIYNERPHCFYALRFPVHSSSPSSLLPLCTLSPRRMPSLVRYFLLVGNWCVEKSQSVTNLLLFVQSKPFVAAKRIVTEMLQEGISYASHDLVFPHDYSAHVVIIRVLQSLAFRPAWCHQAQTRLSADRPLTLPVTR